MPLDSLSQLDDSTDIQRELVRIVSAQTTVPGFHTTAIDDLTLHRCDEQRICEPCMYEPALAFVIQGAKLVEYGDQQAIYGPLDSVACSIHLPVSGRFVEANEAKPFLGIKVRLNTEELTALLMDAGEHPSQKYVPETNGDVVCGLNRSRMDHNMQVAILRLVSLLASPKDIPILAPLAIREIVYRALNSELGPSLRKFAAIDSQANRISQVINTLQFRFSEPLRIAELANEVNMSESSLYHTFKKVTRMSPLQFQKKLRLQEARRLMLAEGLDAASASFRVGYESPSQFSREYSRMFGAPPREDVSKLRGRPEPVEI